MKNRSREQSVDAFSAEPETIRHKICVSAAEADMTSRRLRYRLNSPKMSMCGGPWNAMNGIYNSMDFNGDQSLVYPPRLIYCLVSILTLDVTLCVLGLLS